MTHALKRMEQAIRSRSEDLDLIRAAGTVVEVTPSAYRVSGLSAFVGLGDRVRFAASNGREQSGEVVRVEADAVTVKPYDVQLDAGLGALAFRTGPFRLRPDESWKGRVLNALGGPIDSAGWLPAGETSMPVDAEPPNSMRRSRVRQPLRTGVRAIDIFTPLCLGQRIGVFAGSGVGKSTLLAMLARSSGFDAVVVVLVGERGREVREFIDDTLGGNARSAVLVVSTADESPMMRRLAPRTGMTIAEYFRDRGQSVLLILDSVTRYAHAARDVALAAGEPPVSRGYPPSVFSDLPKLLERAGPGESGGSITGVFSVLVDGDDHNDPVADNVRGTLDGHVVLDRSIADQGRYPAVNLLTSISRLAQNVWTAEQRALVMRLRALVARFEDTRDLRLMGGYQPGNDLELDQAIALVPAIYKGLEQSPSSPLSLDSFQDLATALQGGRKDVPAPT